jgi:hypothetical protein
MRITGPSHGQNAARQQERERALACKAGAGHREAAVEVTGIGFLRLLAVAQECGQRRELREPAREGVQDLDGECALVDQYEEAAAGRRSGMWWWILLVVSEHDEALSGVEVAV